LKPELYATARGLIVDARDPVSEKETGLA
jgi:hypothetical protein